MEQEYVQFYDGDKMGIKTLDDTIIVPAKYDFVASFSGGYFSVHKGKTFSYYDIKGNLLFPFESKYEHYCDFTEGLAAVYDGEHYGFIDERGKEVIAPKFVFAEKFTEGYAIVRNGEHLHGAINTNGEQVIDYTYKTITSFKNGYAQFGDYHTWGLLDIHGNEVVPQIYAFLGDVEEGKLVVQIVQDDGFAKEGVLTLGGEIEWNNNLDEYNARLKKTWEFEDACKSLITEFYQDGCPCERPRFRDYVQCEGDIRKVDQELIWAVFIEKLETKDDINYKCSNCGTSYETDYKEFNAFFGVLQVQIATAGYSNEKGSAPAEIVPFAMGFQAFELEGRIDTYEETDIKSLMAYLKG